MPKFLTAVLSIALIAALCIGCSSSTTSSMPSAPSAPSSTTSASTTTTTQPSDPLKDKERYEFTSDKLDPATWAAVWDYYKFPQTDGTLQFGMGVNPLYCLGAYQNADQMMNKIITMDMSFILRPSVSILLRAAQVGGIGANNPCYALSFEDNGEKVTMKLSRYAQNGGLSSVLAKNIDLTDIINVWDYNRYEIGIFNEGKGIRFAIAINGQLVVNCLDKSPKDFYQENVNFIFQGGNSVVRLRGLDSDATSNIVEPVKTGEVNGVGMYDVSALQDVSARSMATITTAREFTASNGFTVKYRIYLPAHYSESKKYPLQMHLHGGGLRGTNNLTQIMGDFSQLNMMIQHQKKEEFIFIVPECPPDRFWTDAHWFDNEKNDYVCDITNTPEPVQIAALIELMESLTQEFSVDENRWYLSGCSMGGSGSYDLLARYPDKFAAAIVGCASSDVTVAKQLAKTPMYIGHGEADPTIFVQNSRDMVAALKKIKGADFVYKEFEGRGHDFATPEDLAEAMDWIFSKRR